MMHVAIISGYEAPAAKRPNTSFGKVVPTSKILWRPVVNATVAN